MDELKISKEKLSFSVSRWSLVGKWLMRTTIEYQDRHYQNSKQKVLMCFFNLFLFMGGGGPFVSVSSTAKYPELYQPISTHIGLYLSNDSCNTNY